MASTRLHAAGAVLSGCVLSCAFLQNRACQPGRWGVGYTVYSETGCEKVYEEPVGSATKSTESLWTFQSRGGPNLRASSPRLGCGRVWFSSGRPCRALKSPPSPGIQASSDPPTRQTSAVGFTGLGSPRAPDYPRCALGCGTRGARPNPKCPCGPPPASQGDAHCGATLRRPGTRGAAWHASLTRG